MTTTIEIETIKDIIAMSKCVSYDDTRFALCNVRIEHVDATHVKLVACDGIKLMTRVIESTLAEIIPVAAHIHMDKQTLRDLKEIVKRVKYVQVTELLPHPTQKNMFCIGGNSVGVIVNLDLSLFDYPDYSKLWPEFHEEPKQVTLNAKYILQLAESIRNEHVSHITLVIRGEMDPVLVYASNPNSSGPNTGIIMPVRMEKRKLVGVKS